MNETPNGKESWGSRVGVIMAVVGSAVGLGNFLRFPGLAAKYDGGAFMIPYFIAFLLLGLPICWVEWAMGRYGGARGFNSSPGIFYSIWRRPVAPYLGVLAQVIPTMIYMYYIYIEGWCLAYAARYLFGAMDFGSSPGAYASFFWTFVGVEDNGAAFSSCGGSWLGSSVIFVAICFVLNFTLIYRGLTKGIEWCCNIAMPALVVCAIIVLVRVLTLGTPDAAQPDQNLLNGLGFMWNPTTPRITFWESLRNPNMWLEAAGQIFFSLSVGFGVLITYASYLGRDDDIALSSLAAASGNEFCEVALGGMVTIPAAFVFLGADSLLKNPPGTFSLGFITLPNVFHQMWAGHFVGFCFFLLLFLAALTSSLSMLQPAIALLEEGLGLKRKASVAFLGFITAVGASFVVFFSKDLKALDTIDFWIGTFCIFVMATLQVLIFGWVLGIDRGFEELVRGAEIRIPRFMKFVIKYVSPSYLLVVFGFWCYHEFFTAAEDPRNPTHLQQLWTTPVAAYSLFLIIAVVVLFVLLVAQSVKRWDEAKRQAEEIER